MESISEEVKEVYGGSVGDLWALFLGEQLHLGGLESSMDLAGRAGVGPGMTGVDLCCGNGAGMRVLVRLMGVAHMTGIDLTDRNVAQGKERCEAEGLAGQIEMHVRDACDTGFPAGSADFAWGEDAWCYVPDKAKLVAEAARLVKPGGVIAFTDWIEGEAGLSKEAAQRINSFMKFPDMETIEGYRRLLGENGCEVVVAEDTGRFVPCMDLYQQMSAMQFGYDAMKAIGFDMDLMASITEEMGFIRECAEAKGIVQGVFVGRKG